MQGLAHNRKAVIGLVLAILVIAGIVLIATMGGGTGAGGY
jgi:hypothetical protein